jgi:hypothetical protein
VIKITITKFLSKCELQIKLVLSLRKPNKKCASVLTEYQNPGNESDFRLQERFSIVREDDSKKSTFVTANVPFRP